MAKNRVQEAKKLRKAVQIALSGVSLDADDVADLQEIFDPFNPEEKYKKGEIATFNGKNYICTKTVKPSKEGKTPDQDAEHWQLLTSAVTEPEQPDTGDEGDVPWDDIPVWTQPIDEKTYRKGDEVHYPDASGPVYVSNVNKNTSVPGENGDWTVKP